MIEQTCRHPHLTSTATAVHDDRAHSVKESGKTPPEDARTGKNVVLLILIGAFDGSLRSALLTRIKVFRLEMMLPAFEQTRVKQSMPTGT